MLLYLGLLSYSQIMKKMENFNKWAQYQMLEDIKQTVRCKEGS